MCFSSTASFGISSALAIVGIATVKQARTSDQMPLAIIPFVFSIQQFCEGFVWLSFTRPGYENIGHAFIYAFLIFAQIVWPFLVPYSIYRIEKDVERKKKLLLLLICGAILSAYLLFSLFYYPASAMVINHHIRYDLERPMQFIYLTAILYFIVTIIPPFVSGFKNVALIGFFNLSSFLITVIFFSEYLISVWCYFAATISISVFFVLKTNSYKVKTSGSPT